MAFENRRYLVIPVEVLDQVNFNQIGESSPDTCRRSVDGTKTIIKYDVNIVEQDITDTGIDAETGEEFTHTIAAGVYGRPSIYSDQYPEYTHAEILEIVNGPLWTVPEEGV